MMNEMITSFPYVPLSFSSPLSPLCFINSSSSHVKSEPKQNHKKKEQLCIHSFTPQKEMEFSYHSSFRFNHLRKSYSLKNEVRTEKKKNGQGRRVSESKEKERKRHP